MCTKACRAAVLSGDTLASACSGSSGMAPTGPAPCCWASKRLRPGPAPPGAHSPPETHASDCCMDSEWLGLNPEPQLSRVCTSHPATQAPVLGGARPARVCLEGQGRLLGGGGTLELEWGLNNQGELRTGKDIAERGLPKSHLSGPPPQSLQNPRTTCTVIHLMFIFKASFPFYLKKFFQLKRRLLLLP